MLRPAHFLSTAVLAAFVIPLLDAMPKSSEQTSATSMPSPVTTYRMAAPAETVSNIVPTQIVPTQRWVF